VIDSSTAATRIRVLHVVTGLGRGGAETSLLRTLAHADPDRFSHHVVSLVPSGELAYAVRETGAEVLDLPVAPGVLAFLSLARLGGIMRSRRPDLVQTWMYHSDLLGGLAARIAGSPPVVWGLHHANLDPKLNKRSTLGVARTCATLSGWLPSAIVCCSEATRRIHADFGYEAGKMHVIPNGYEVEDFRPDPTACAEVRRELGLTDDDLVVGMVGRYHPLKDHRNFLAAARRLLDAGVAARFVLCGLGVDEANDELMALVDRYELREVTNLLGERKDPQRIMNGFDLGTISSAGEGFPNVVCEMMLCGIPCVVTDVGDAALIVGETGQVVPSSDAAALAEGWRHVLQLDAETRHSKGKAARLRIVRNYSAEAISLRYHQLWSGIVGR
jgi:glycosyltransferase involved in cell wall biosynthesis